MRRILCAVDHSEQSLRGSKVAAELAAKCHADLFLLNIVQLPDGKPPQGIAEYLRHEHNANPPSVMVVEAAQNELSMLSDRLASEKRIPITCEVRAGEAASEIVAAAREHGIDAIVMGHRSHNRLAQVLIGSVARRVVDTAPCPVMIVR